MIFLSIKRLQTPGFKGLSTAIIFATTVPTLVFAQTGASLDAGLYVPGELLVKYKSESKPRTKASIEQRHKLKAKSRYTALGFERWVLQSPAELADALKSLAADPNIEFVEPNYRRFARALPAEGSLGSSQYIDLQKSRLDQINLPAAWDAINKTTQVKVAVIDNGFEIRHPDLVDNASLAESKDFVNNDADPEPGGDCEDPSGEGHGTAVAGVVGARTNNSVGIAGVAWNVNLLLLKIGCDYSVSNEAAAIDYAISRQVNIINASYGGPMYSEAERVAIKALEASNILFVSAAGNSRINNDVVLDYPSALNLPNIMSVAATDTTNALPDWTQYGQTRVDIAAPGVEVYLLGLNSTYLIGTGTSFSAPMVSGVASLLLKSGLANLTYLDLKAAILASADPLANNVKARLATDGQVDALAALQAVKQPAPLIVIDSVKFNDSNLGNNSGEIDINENGAIQVVLENVWKDASNISLSLSADELSAPITRTVSSLPSNQKTTVDFTLDKPLLAKDEHRRVVFQLAIDGFGATGKAFRYTRAFEIELGHLRRDKPIETTINASAIDHDQMHRYHFDLASGVPSATIEVTANRLARAPLYLMVRYGSPPQFQLLDGITPTSIEADDKSKDKTELAFTTQADTNSDYTAEIKLTNPKAGKYYVIVTSGNNARQDIEYHLQLTAPRTVVRRSGCTLSLASDSREAAFDPILPSLIVLSIIVIGFRNRAAKN